MGTPWSDPAGGADGVFGKKREKVGIDGCGIDGEADIRRNDPRKVEPVPASAALEDRPL
jgi:hypothetical protein